MKGNFFILVIACMSCRQLSGNIIQMSRLSESDFLINQDSVIEKLDKLNYITQYTLLDKEFKMKFILDSILPPLILLGKTSTSVHTNLNKAQRVKPLAPPQ